MCVWCLSPSVVPNSLQPNGLCSLSGYSVHGIFQARILSGLPCPSPGDLPSPGSDWTWTGRQILHYWTTREAHIHMYSIIHLYTMYKWTLTQVCFYINNLRYYLFSVHSLYRNVYYWNSTQNECQIISLTLVQRRSCVSMYLFPLTSHNSWITCFFTVTFLSSSALLSFSLCLLSTFFLLHYYLVFVPVVV